MPSRPHALPFALALAAALAAGCSAQDPVAVTAADPSRSAGAPAAPATAAQLAALADDRPATALPPATVTADQTLAALAATLPEPAAVGEFDAPAVGRALDAAARVVAATRADRDYLCGPVAADPAGALATPGLKRFLADPANADARRSVEQPISGAGDGLSCGPLAWVGPGVVPGPQTWTVRPGPDGTDLTVVWEGTLGYALAAGGVPEPWGLTARGAYDLAPAPGGGWLLDGYDATTRGSVLQAWPQDVKLPDGYLQDPDAPAGDPAALDALRKAAEAWRQSAGVTAVQKAASGNAAVGDEFERGKAALKGRHTVAPARGDADGTIELTGEKTGRLLLTDMGRTALREVTRPQTPKRGRTLPSPLGWLRQVETDPGSGGASFAVNAFRTVGLLDEADAAAPAPCPKGREAAACFTAVIATGRGDVPIAAQHADGLYRAGLPWLVLAVGLDADGRPAHVDFMQASRAFGEEFSTLAAQTTFTDYTQAAPPPPALPDPKTVADAGDVQQ